MFQWYMGSVCGIGATNDVATVACRELNHAATGGLLSSLNITIIINFRICVFGK